METLTRVGSERTVLGLLLSSENLANLPREIVTVARRQVCQCHESVEFGLQVYGMKRYCGGERPDLLLGPVIGILVEFSCHHAFAIEKHRRALS